MKWVRANRVGVRIGCSLLALCAAGGVRGEPLDALRACAERAAPTASGLAALEAACPGLGAALSQLEVDQWLENGWREHLDRRQLANLAAVIESYQGAAPQPPIDTATLPAILKALREAEPRAPNTVWQALKSWVSDLLSRLDIRLGSWVDRWLSRIGSAVSLVNVLLYGLVGLVLTATAVVIVNELRAAGMLGRARARARQRAADSASAAHALPPPPIESLPMRERPAQLLRLLVRRLVETRRLDRERALTHDELVARGVFDSIEQRAAFHALATVAARILYGPRPPASSEMESALRGGQALLATIAVLPETAK